MRHGNAVSSHSGFIKIIWNCILYYIMYIIGSLRPIARKKNLISVCSAAFITIFLFNLVHSYKCHDNFINRSIIFLKAWQSRELVINLYCLQVPRTLKIRTAFKWVFKCHNFPHPQRFGGLKWTSSLFTELLFSNFIFTCTTLSKKKKS